MPVNKTYLSYVQELVAENHYEKVTVIEGSHSRHRSIYTGVLELRKGKVHVPYLFPVLQIRRNIRDDFPYFSIAPCKHML